MNLIQHNLFPGGKRKAVTLSYDDGVRQDRKFVEILKRHGVKSTFHLNIEIADYLRAITQLRTDVAGNHIQNFSSQSVWISINREASELASGQLLKIV
ncbi:MAG: polysaccharide deacetylase family protein [Chthoniobacterales bacterium]